MPAEARILDASVIVKCFLFEEDSELARLAVARRDDWIAPDLLFVEVASVALKSFRRGLIERSLADTMVATAPRMVRTATPASRLCQGAFRLAADHGFSAYDATYLALAELQRAPLLTADARMIERARAVGLGDLVEALNNA